jgi:hypothetical protein
MLVRETTVICYENYKNAVLQLLHTDRQRGIIHINRSMRIKLYYYIYIIIYY